MPTLEDIRRWARGEAVNGLPTHKQSEEAVDEIPKPRGGVRTWQYKVNASGTDALLKFGKHRGKTISYLVEHHPDYLQWMLNGGRGRGVGHAGSEPFDEALLDVVRYQLTLAEESGR